MESAIRYFLLLLVACGAGARGAEEGADGPPAGHSHQGHAFNEGPRQSAILIPGTGKVNFPVKSKWEKGQTFFDQGVGQLHGFWYDEAERSFREIAAHDPECAMAYWGMAMANWENQKRAKGFIEKAVERKDQASPRNRLYIEAQANFLDDEPTDKKRRNLELIHDLENIIHEHPEDIEARAFIACRMWQFMQKGIPITSHEAVDALLKPVFEQIPMHPAHHYRIHVWDAHKAARALDSAAILGPCGPAIAHMWHMPGHIYSKLKRWDDSAFAQRASARIDHKHMIERRLLPDQIHNYAHNNEWLVRNWMYMGRATDALEMAKSLVANPRHPKWNTIDGKGRSSKYGRERLCQVLERFELWDQTIEMATGPYLEPTDLSKERNRRLLLMSRAYFGKGDSRGLGLIERRMAVLKKRAQERQESAEVSAREQAIAELKDDNAIEEAVKQAGKKAADRVKSLEQVAKEIEVYRAILNGDLEIARKHFGEVKREKFILARLRLQLGDEEEALSLSAEAVKRDPAKVLPLIARIEILHAAGKDEEARATLEDLRPNAAYLDPVAPPVQRVLKLAAKLGVPEDWRKEPPVRDDIGERPDLDTLGPIAWQPFGAPYFSLPDRGGKRIALSDYSGRPLLLIFYLGHGCLHCVEQLQLFGNEVEKITNAGFDPLAISTDSIADLRKSLEAFAKEGEQYPIPLIADPELKIFRQWNAYDDFEKEPLHGTFVIDPGGRVLWQDISYDPFMDLDFVLREGKRLLKLHSKPEKS